VREEKKKTKSLKRNDTLDFVLQAKKKEEGGETAK